MARLAHKFAQGFSLALIALACLTLCGCEFLTFRKYTSLKYGFSMLTPRAWKRVADARAALMLKEPLDGPKDKYPENINLMFSQLPTAVPSEVFLDYNKAELKRIMPNLEDMQEYAVSNGLIPGRVLAFDSTIEGLSLHMVSAVWMKDARVYVLTCSAEKSKFKRYEPIFNKAISSFRVL